MDNAKSVIRITYDRQGKLAEKAVSEFIALEDMQRYAFSDHIADQFRMLTLVSQYSLHSRKGISRSVEISEHFRSMGFRVVSIEYHPIPNFLALFLDPPPKALDEALARIALREWDLPLAFELRFRQEELTSESTLVISKYLPGHNADVTTRTATLTAGQAPMMLGDQGSDLDLQIDPGDASIDDIRALLQAFDELARAHGATGIRWSIDGSGLVLEGERAR